MRTPDTVGERARLAFFRSFIALLMLAIAASEWAVAARVLGLAGADLPWPAHLVGPATFWAVNRAVVRRRGTFPEPLATAVRAYAGVAFTCVFCGVFLGLAALAQLVLRLGAAPAGAILGATVPPGGGRWLDVVTDGGLFGIAGLFLWGYTGGRRRLAVTRYVVPVRGLPAALDGLRIVHVTDLHIGTHLGLAELAAHVARVNALAPDLVCVTGDLVDRAATCADAFPVLAGLRARHGVFVTLGNHDHGAGADAVAAALGALTAFTLLRDQAVTVAVGGASLAVIGLDDLGRDWARGVPEHPALPPLVGQVPAGAPLVVLSHRPDCFPQAVALGASLMLSGHTHGGQLALPGWRRVRNLAEFITAFDRGVYQDGDATLLVNRGLGFTGQPIRLFTPREIACLELRAVAARVPRP